MCSLRKISVSLLLVFLSLTASGGDPYFLPAGAAEAGMGYSCVAGSGFWAAFHNQAILGEVRYSAAGISYINRFGISELGTRSAAIIMPSGRAAVGGIFSHSGYRDFRRLSAGVACGMPITAKIAGGIQIDYLSEKTWGEYGAKQLLTFEAGVLISSSEKVRFGIHLFNPLPGSIRKTRLPSSIRAGVGAGLSKSLFVTAEVTMSTGRRPDLRTGMEYRIGENLQVRGGFCTESTSFSFGVGYRVKSIIVDFAAASHERLGITSVASVIFKIGTRKSI
ncbi:MAG: hypothetical protein WCE64_09260 [Bacteroidales bacterium]